MSKRLNKKKVVDRNGEKVKEWFFMGIKDYSISNIVIIKVWM